MTSDSFVENKFYKLDIQFLSWNFQHLSRLEIATLMFVIQPILLEVSTLKFEFPTSELKYNSSLTLKNSWSLKLKFPNPKLEFLFLIFKFLT